MEDIDKEASLLSPCPVPLSSIVDNILIDEIISVMHSSPITINSINLSTLPSDHVYHNTFDEIRIQMRNGYMTLSQLRRLVDAITNNDMRPLAYTSGLSIGGDIHRDIFVMISIIDVIIYFSFTFR
jgi:hypothetical protein